MGGVVLLYYRHSRTHTKIVIVMQSHCHIKYLATLYLRSVLSQLKSHSIQSQGHTHNVGCHRREIPCLCLDNFYILQQCPEETKFAPHSPYYLLVPVSVVGTCRDVISVTPNIFTISTHSLPHLPINHCGHYTKSFSYFTILESSLVIYLQLAPQSFRPSHQ